MDRTTTQVVADAPSPTKFAPSETPVSALTSPNVLRPSAQSGGSAVHSAPSLPLPATVPLRPDDLQARCPHGHWRPDPSTNVFNHQLGAHGAEQFRTLRSRLYQVRGLQPLRTILITSAVSGEGKTFMASNLARAFVRQADRRALLIDGDLRNPCLHIPLGAPTTPGLSDYLSGAADEISVMQYGEDPNLFFIPGGRIVQNPSELLSNGRMKTLIDRVSSIFDWIIIDSPPCLPVADASVLAGFCDGLLLVVRANSTPSAVVQKAGEELQGRPVIGVALNAVKENTLSYGTYYRRGYYGNDDAKPTDTEQPTAEAVR